MQLLRVGTSKDRISKQRSILCSKIWPGFSSISEVLVTFPNLTALIGGLKNLCPGES